jgi:spore germination protein GerM
MRRHRARAAIVLALAAIVATAACGVTANDEPQAIAADKVPAELLDPDPATSTTVPQAGGTTPVSVYLLEETTDGVRLVAVERVTQAGGPANRLAALFDGPTEEETDQGIVSAIPTSTELLEVRTDDETGEVVIDLSEFPPIEGAALAQAYAQMVWTATGEGSGGFNRVRFLVEGEPITVPDDDSAEQEGAVQRADYLSLEPER